MALSTRLRNFSHWHVEKRLLGVLLRPDARSRAERIAECLIPTELIRPEWICYCAGVGEDIRLEQAISGKHRANVWSFDPTPRSIAFMQRTPHDSSKLRFMPVGLWKEDTTLRFHAPAVEAHVSHSVMGTQGGDRYFDATCRSVPSLMKELGHERIDLLKMNIEGAEDVVLESVLAAGIRPTVITMTIEGERSLPRALAWTKRLRGDGWRLLGRLAWWFTFVRE